MRYGLFGLAAWFVWGIIGLVLMVVIKFWWVIAIGVAWLIVSAIIEARNFDNKPFIEKAFSETELYEVFYIGRKKFKKWDSWRGLDMYAVGKYPSFINLKPSDTVRIITG